MFITDEAYMNLLSTQEFVKVYRRGVKGANRRGRPLGRWKDRVKEYVRGE